MNRLRGEGWSTRDAVKEAASRCGLPRKPSTTWRWPTSLPHKKIDSTIKEGRTSLRYGLPSYAGDERAVTHFRSSSCRQLAQIFLPLKTVMSFALSQKIQAG